MFSSYQTSGDNFFKQCKRSQSPYLRSPANKHTEITSPAHQPIWDVLFFLYSNHIFISCTPAHLTNIFYFSPAFQNTWSLLYSNKSIIFLHAARLLNTGSPVSVQPPWDLGSCACMSGAFPPSGCLILFVTCLSAAYLRSGWYPPKKQQQTNTPNKQENKQKQQQQQQKPHKTTTTTTKQQQKQSCLKQNLSLVSVYTHPNPHIDYQLSYCHLPEIYI